MLLQTFNCFLNIMITFINQIFIKIGDFSLRVKVEYNNSVVIKNISIGYFVISPFVVL